jgi:hypothetical protein
MAIPRRWLDKKRCSCLVIRVLHLQNIEVPMWEVGLTIENTLYRLLVTLLDCEMYQGTAVKLSSGLAHPLTPKQPMESFARVEGWGSIQEELLGQRFQVKLFVPKAAS